MHGTTELDEIGFDKFGKPFEYKPIRCKCGHRLFDLLEGHGSVVSIKCPKCKHINRLSI